LPFCSDISRDFELPGRSEALSMRVMAATSHPLATLTALDVLRRGGGTAQAIWIDWQAGVLRGGADGRRDGLAAGW